MKAKHNKNNKKSGKTPGKRSYAGGDIPPPNEYTHSTMSCPLPRITERVTARSVANTTIVATPTADVKTSFNFQLGNANIGTGFFDQYRIMAVRFTVVAQNNAIGLVTNTTTTLSPMYIVIDYDDSSNLASVAAAEAYSNCLVLHPGESCERIFKPRMALGAYTGTFVGFANVADQWIDAASTTVQHYGIKTIVPGVTAAQTLLQSWDVHIEYFFEFRKTI
jgi:hypothetical protein